MLEGYLRTDERIDVISALSHCLCCVRKVEEDPLEWKWAIISLHNALQGSLVCTLSGTAGIGALTKKSRIKVLEWLEKTRSEPDPNRPKEWLADVKELYRRAKKPELMGEYEGDPLRTTPAQDDSARRLNLLRHDFMHFPPKGWSVELAGLPHIFLSVLDLIETLMCEHPANTFRLEDRQMAEIKSVLREMRKITKGLSPGTT